MTKDYRYKLEKGSKKSRCPECGKSTFVRYVDSNTSEYLPDRYGRCDRESKCSYHFNPYHDGYSKMIWESEKSERPKQTNFLIKNTKSTSLTPVTAPVFIPLSVFNQTRQGYEKNVFIQNLLSRVSYPFDSKDVERVISHYHLGTVCNGYRAGGISFPYIDKSGNIRAIQVKQFDQANHTTSTDKLDKVILNHCNKNSLLIPEWLNEYLIYCDQYGYFTCLFGEHLLNKYPLNPIALVEAPKTAVYGTLYFGFPERPENLLWLAVYNLSSLSIEKCKVLKGRDVYLFPDLSKEGKAFQSWNNKANKFTSLMPGTSFKVSDLLESFAPDELRASGADIADLLIKMDWRKFRLQQMGNERLAKVNIEQPLPSALSAFVSQPESLSVQKSEKSEAGEQSKQTFFQQSERLSEKVEIKNKERENWQQDISELEDFFGNISIPNKPVTPNHYTTITNVLTFIEKHLAIVKSNNGKRAFLPYLNRLQELKLLITNLD